MKCPGLKSIIVISLIISVMTIQSYASSPESYENPLDALKSMDFETFKSLKPEIEALYMGKAVSLMMKGRYHDAERTLNQLRMTRPDGEVGRIAMELQALVLLHQSEWRKLANLNAKKYPLSYMESAATLLRNAPNCKPFYSNVPVTLRAVCSPGGPPIADIMINGQSKRMVLDPALFFSFITDKTAGDSLIIPLEETQLVIPNGDESLKGPVGLLDNLQLDELLVKNLPVIIEKQDDLMPGILSKLKILEIDGVFGWNLLGMLDYTLSVDKGIMHISLPDTEAAEGIDYFWFGMPVIRTPLKTGEQVLMGIDFRLKKSQMSPEWISKFKPDPFKEKAAKKRNRNRNDPVRIPLVISNHVVNLKNPQTFSGDDEAYFIELDGIVGMDVIKRYDWRFNAPAGILSIVDK